MNLINRNETQRVHKTEQTKENEMLIQAEFLKHKLQSDLIDKDTIQPKEGHVIVETLRQVSRIYTVDTNITPQLLRIVRIPENSKYQIGQFIIIDKRFVDQAPLVYYKEIKQAIEMRAGEPPVEYTVGEYDWKLINESYIMGTYYPSEAGKDVLNQITELFPEQLGGTDGIE